MLPAEGEPLSSEKAQDVHEAIKKVLASLYKQLEFWKVADMKNFDVAEAWLKEQLGGHDSEWQKQLEVAEKWIASRASGLSGPQPFVADNLSGAVTHADWVSQQIWDLQCKGSVVPVSMVPTVVSPLNVVLRGGKPRLVLDLTYVNSFIDTSGLKFKYEQLNWASVVVQPNDFLFSVDLEAAYHHVEMHPSSWRYLGFCWEGQYYVFTVLPLGLNTACWVFTKLTRELVSHWRGQGIRSVHYLDDFLFAVPKDVDGGDTQFRAVQAKILADIKAAGFSLSEPKLKLDPSQGWGGYTVSSSSGFKAQVAVGMDEFLTDHRSQIAQGYLSPSEQLESSTWRELIAIERVLLSLGHLLAGKVARLLTDNQAVTFLWAKDVLPALSNGVLNAASDPQLVELYDQLPSVLAAAKATSTWKRYTPMWDRFKQWCQGSGVSFLPAEPLIVALYLLMLMQIAGSFKTIKEAAKRVLHAGVNRKEPLTWDAVVQIAQKALEPAATLKQLLIATIISVGFCGFFRYDDLSKITVDLVVMYRSHMEEGKEVYGEQPISYSCLRGMLLAAIADIGLPVEAFGTHSLRAGGATLAANQGPPHSDLCTLCVRCPIAKLMRAD
ncbi:g5275 [Coccomyxa elongata]